MPIGDSQKYVSGWKTKYLYAVLGTLDLHSHIRLSPLINYLNIYFNQTKTLETSILELGCGSGIVAFEIAKLAEKYSKKIDYLGIDINDRSIDLANKVLASRPFGGVKFICGDVTAFMKEYTEYKADIIVLFDIIEHISNVNNILSVIYSCLNPGGIFIVSVPTNKYPLVFGRDFHTKIGHVVDGYSLEGLDKMFVDNLQCKREYYKYNTGLVSQYGCAMYYNIFKFENKYMNIIKSLILYPFKYLDIYNSPKISCSIFAVYKKV